MFTGQNWLFIRVRITGYNLIFVISLFNNFDIQVHAAEETNSFDNDLLINPAEYSGYGCTDGKDLKEENIDHDQNTVIEDNSGFGCGSTCGASREDGYSTTYQNGCRNWQVMPIISPLYKYWIDESSLSDLTDYQKALFIKYVDEAAAEWNSVRIADYDGKIVKLEKQSSNGLNVVPVRYNPNLDSGIAGQFNPVPLLHEIEIKRYNDYDTIMHEFGHMIGLQDLDLNNSPGTHISLMGYASDDKLHYQDIQGLAVANGKHTKHDFQKYWYDGTWYNYVCFYCDATDSVLTNWGGGSHLEMANTCIHDYRDLVSAGDRHWQKCTKCYKVIECEFRVNVLNSGDIEITGLIDDRTTITIPREIGGQKVVAIKANAFANLSNLQTVNFHYNCNITLIGNSAFKGCSNLTSISLPNTITNIDSSAFENCSYLQSVKLPTNLVAIGSSAFKGCGSLATITIPSGVTYIDSSAFENCSYLQSVTLPTNLVAIGSSAFKGCGSLGNITIPNSVTNIDSSAFENCSYLQSVTLSSNLNAIGVSAFKGCGSLGSITIPSNVQHIDESAFENCVSLVSVIVEREISNITNLGNYAFAGCSSALQIIVPQNRVAEYKNEVYWSSYKNIIVANDDNFSEIELHCLSDFYNLTSLDVNYNKLYKLNVLCGKSYQIIADSNSDVKINLYDSNMNLISTNVNSLITYLGVNTYYMDMELENATSSEIITTTFELRWEHDGERIYYNDEHNLLTHLHQLSNDTYFTKLYYINNNGAGFYKVQISGNTQNGSLLSTELGTISIYNNSDKTIDQLLSKYPNSNEYAITNVGQDTMYVYLPRNGYFYINVMMPSNNYESLDLTISNVESETIDLFTKSESANSTMEILNFETTKGDYAK